MARDMESYKAEMNQHFKDFNNIYENNQGRQETVVRKIVKEMEYIKRSIKKDMLKSEDRNEGGTKDTAEVPQTIVVNRRPKKRNR